MILRKLFLFLVLFSCASGDKEYFKDSQKDLVEVFEIKDERLSQFKVQKIAEAPKRESELDKKKLKEPQKTITKKEKKSEKIKTSSKEKRDIKGKMSLPSDYPEEFRQYDKKSASFWHKYKPRIYVDEEFKMNIQYIGITAGYITISSKEPVVVDGVQAYNFVGRVRSATFFEYIYKLDDSVETFVSLEDFIPLRYNLKQRESAQRVDDLQLFDHEKRKTFFLYHRIKKGKETKRNVEAYIPEYFHDSFSALFFIRGLPLKLGDKYEFPIVTRGKLWILKMKVVKFDEVKINDKWIPSIQISAETRFPGVLKKRGDILFWYSRDALRKILKFEAKVKIGTVSGELLEYRPGNLIE